ncbi:glycine-rich domain-containing protein [Flavobacterium sp. C4GT6]|uniref:glycine-rich domain-containing protein n=1 Tax=Flavobacterium sp. C4GT6 TaxID=3103818 RepID=UPI002ED31358
MTAPQKNLWDKISNFRMDDPDSSFTFSARLARENGWTKEYTKSVIEEYRKFIFLCCVSKSSVTPSDPVDQVWHLHLTYTKSYWIDFCKNTLQREIHHNPTKGGKSERKKFNNNYTELHTIYKKMFDNNPPQDIWQDNKTRFTKINFRRVSMDNYWLIKKPPLLTLKLIQLSFIGLAVGISIQASGNKLGIIVVILFLIALFRAIKKGGDGNGNSNSSSGCSTWDNFDSGCSSHGDSGCGSGCSGCSGCGGCSGD